MIYDKQLLFSDNQAVTVSAASTDHADLENVGADYGPGYPVQLKAVVGTAFAASGAGTLTVKIQDSANGSDWADLASSAAVGKADLLNGRQITLALPEAHRRYIRAYYTVGTGPMTAGTISAFITASR